MRPLIDSFGRKIDYLRLSVTDRCNLRCVYCLPADGAPFLRGPQVLGALRRGPADGFVDSRSGDILTDEEIVRVVSVAVRLGINKIRITGGEPLVRPGIVSLVGRLAQIPGLEDISISTNGTLLSKLALDLYRAGLNRINVSVDTLKPERFRTIARFGDLGEVLEGIRAALEIGFSPVKINAVVMNGINSEEIPDFVSWTRRWPVHVRFIELMPIGETGFFSPEHWLPQPEIRARCGELEPLSREDSPRGFGPAVYFRSPGALGTVGFIGALSCNFCSRCNRLRLTSRGRLLPCLASEMGEDLTPALRSRGNEDGIEEIIRRVVDMKPERHQMDSGNGKVREAFMCALGG
ncbi:MAG: GTP 3',8-cyclase MoaA [Elusimicrobia bacterium]|nr:GTP 3',8-cyclase MoaA [Elusimicrobiota bacterium]